MEMWSIGYLIGIITTIIFVGIGVCLGRADKDFDKRNTEGRVDRSSTDNIHVHRGCGGRSSNNRCNKPMDAEEAINILQTLRVGASRTEKDALDYACKLILIIKKGNKT